MFQNNTDVAFGDVNLADQDIRDGYDPGAGGWPTIRYFNKETGYKGAPYKQKTSDAMCDELGDDSNMQAYVEEAGHTALCKASDGAGCNEKELKFIEEWTGKDKEAVDAQLHRLRGMAGSNMRPEGKEWVVRRLSILKQFHQPPKDEL